VIHIELHEILRSLRLEKGWSQLELSEHMSALGFPGSQKAISRWERGDTEPSVRQFIALCGLYEVRDVPALFGISPSQDRLNALGHKRVQEYIRLLEQDAAFSVEPQPIQHIIKRSIPLYDLPVSAGLGHFLDSSDYTMLEVDDTVPLSATFAVRIQGDSMTPRFSDRQIVFVHQQQTLEDGEIGIFLLDGDAYCKLLRKQNGTFLISLNTDYAPIPVQEFSELRVLGKVIG